MRQQRLKRLTCLLQIGGQSVFSDQSSDGIQQAGYPRQVFAAHREGCRDSLVNVAEKPAGAFQQCFAGNG
jgi:hypothetical protein